MSHWSCVIRGDGVRSSESTELLWWLTSLCLGDLI
ncbi:hypothetical protein AALP_AA6G196100 [Arabis alpina]|uniref:Uncharacterized protein n=1 Tax=Arabis alpina TaxID=50452 RepID=A0A087GQC2_ARAAL|nr:hypothetical protein AALP_AA6G196100 [Arabis alpina]